LANKESASFTWQGTPSSDWNDPNNWSTGTIPDQNADIIIPDAATTLHDPLLPDSPSASVKTITIQSGGILEGGSATTLTITGSAGAWLNMGVLNPGTSTVVFTHANATIADPTNFYNVTIANGAGLTPETNNIMRISGALTLQGTGILRAALLPNTIEFNGADQNIINPNGLTPGYYNLILSGSGTKTLPGTAMSIAGDFSTSGTATATAVAAITVGGNLTIGVGSTFNTGIFNHYLAGNFDDNGTFNAASGDTITFNGTSAQSIEGSAASNFDNLTNNNSNGVNLLVSGNVNNILTLTSGNLSVGSATLGINGTISKSFGYINVSAISSLSFGGTTAITIPADLFTSTPSINNLTINRTGGVILGNQNMLINGLLDLQSGTLTLGANSLTIAGSSPSRSSGNIDAGNTGATIAFTNPVAITLPQSIFTGVVNNLTINGTGGVTAGSDFTVNGILNLQSENPLANKGSLDMWDGAAIKTLTMGPDATTDGIGDVTGIISRTSFIANTPYSFGNRFSTITLLSGGIIPSQIQLKISIGTSPSWKPSAINRIYEYIQTGGSNCLVTIATHYLDTELNGNNENGLVIWGYGTAGALVGLNELGRSNYSTADDWVAVSGINIGYLPTAFGQFENSFANSELLSYTWKGTQSTSWTDPDNWTPVGTPSSLANIIIPDASTTLYSPTLPASTEMKTLTIQASGVVNAIGNEQLTLNGDNGAWSNEGGTFNAGTGNVIFTNAAATMLGTTNFYNVTINSGKVLWMTSNSIMRIAGTMTNNGVWHTVIGTPVTVEYNGGAQTIAIPNPATNEYNTLILSGSGIKTMPGAALDITGDFSLSGAASATLSGALTVEGDLTISNGTRLSIAPAKSLTVSGNFTNNAGTSGLVLESTASGTGSLIHNTPGVSAIIQRYMTNDRWHIIATPASGQSIPVFLSDISNTIPTSGLNYGMMQYSEPGGGWIYYTNPASGSLSVGTGYLLRHTADNAVLLYGILNAASTDVPVTKSANGWNCIGNPFPCSIGVRSDATTTDNFLSYNAAKFDPSYAVLYLWNEPAVRTAGVSYYNIIGNAGFTSARPALNQAYLQPGQGFIVKSIAAGISMSFTTAMRIHENTGSFFKSAEASWPGINLIVSSPTKSASTAITLHEGMTTGLDVTYDAGLLGGDPSFRLYSRLVDDNGVNFMLQCLPVEGFDNMYIPIGFDYADGGTVTFSADIVPLPSGLKAILTDSLLGKYTDLGEPSATYTADINSSTSGTGRFFLNISRISTFVNTVTDVNILDIYSFRKEIIVKGKVKAGTSANLYDLVGRLVRNYKLSSPDMNTLPADGIQSGVYILRVFGEGFNQNSKLFLK
jgi:hypothetical protein